jgi:nicotinamidase-related amidase
LIRRQTVARLTVLLSTELEFATSLQLNPLRTAMVAIDMHRGHLDPSVATLPLPAERCPGVIARARALFTALRGIGVPVVHVVTVYRDPAETLANPFWNAIANDPTKKRSGNRRHNIVGMPGTEIIPDLLDPADRIVSTKKRYSAFFGTDLDFLLSRRLKVDTLILAGINTTSCILCSAFDATNRDYRVVVAADACDSMDGEEAHAFALALMANVTGWVMSNDEILQAFGIGRRRKA